MFTGIITDCGTVTEIDKTGDWKIRIQTSFDMDQHPIGASIACSGVCLTVVEKDKNSFLVQVSQETLDKTALDQWQVGTKINLETSLRMGDELGGHLVFGHVDGLGLVESITPVGDSHHVIVRLPENLKHFAADKGSIALDGISLTVNKVDDDRIHLMIIPHTWAVTSWGQLTVGQKIHVEADMLARYVARLSPGLHGQLSGIQERNRRVEINKAWEISWVRRVFIMIITYIVVSLMLYTMGSINWMKEAIIPVTGYVISTLTLPLLKAHFISKYFRSESRTS